MDNPEKDKKLIHPVLSDPLLFADEEALYQPIRLDPTAEQSSALTRTTTLFATHCMVDLAKWKRKAKQWMSGDAKWPIEPNHERFELLKQFAELLAALPSVALPDVVVMSWENVSGLRTNYAIIDGIIFLNSSLSEDWTNGKESAAALRILLQTVQECMRVNMPAIAMRMI